MKICVVGLGYVGLPLAIELNKHFDVIGFDIDKKRISNLLNNEDSSNEISKEVLERCSIIFTSNESRIKESNFIIICVPTPVDNEKVPDLSYLSDASNLVGLNLKKNSIVVYESTVYPGVTEDVCVPILEKVSGMKFEKDFKVGYSPERINPGDKKHTIDKITKVISGSDKECLDIIEKIYGKITNVFKADSIKVAEAAKVIENVQRDLNIALMNELKILFEKLNINMDEVLSAANTKWNFHKYYPGLVGGHCIGIDPYYLTYRSKQVGYTPKIILAGRRINDHMHEFYAKKIIEKLKKNDLNIKHSKVLILGLTFKKNVKDYRNTRVKNLIKSLEEKNIKVSACDPLLNSEIVQREFGLKNIELTSELINQSDLVVLAVKHDCFNKFLMEAPKDKLFII